MNSNSQISLRQHRYRPQSLHGTIWGMQDDHQLETSALWHLFGEKHVAQLWPFTSYKC